jgi:hypothetical protein
MSRYIALQLFIFVTSVGLLLACVRWRVVKDERQPLNDVRATESSVEKARTILSSATYLDNLVAGERAPAGEQIWAFNVLLGSVSPEREFRQLFNDDKHYVICYGLIGMKILNDDLYNESSRMFARDLRTYDYTFGCQGMDITNREFLDLLDSGLIKPEYFKIKEFGPYLDERERFLKDAARFMINTGFGL